MRSLVETGSLVGERGAYRLARPLPAIQVPATVQAVLAARIDRLSPADRAVLQTASVVGKDVPLGLLQAIAGRGEAELRAAIGRLQAAEFLYETRIFPDVEYTFKHALTHDVTYGGLLQERRRRLHGQIVEAIERRYPDRLGEHVERLAHHAFRAEEWEKAVGYLRQAGAKALARSANLEAAAHMERALEALGHLPESPETLEVGGRPPDRALERARPTRAVRSGQRCDAGRRRRRGAARRPAPAQSSVGVDRQSPVFRRSPGGVGGHLRAGPGGGRGDRGPGRADRCQHEPRSQRLFRGGLPAGPAVPGADPAADPVRTGPRAISGAPSCRR